MSPSEYVESSSRSMRGHLPICPSSEASELARKRLWSPTSSFAHMVRCVYAPPAETSSLFCAGRPHLTRALWKRDSGATYASTPRMGLTPASMACL